MRYLPGAIIVIAGLGRQKPGYATEYTQNIHATFSTPCSLSSAFYKISLSTARAVRRP